MARGRRRRGRRNRKGKMSRYDYEKEPMLSMRKTRSFKYDLNQILQRTDLDESVQNTLTASIIAKGSRNSIKDARDYIFEMVDEYEALTDEVADQIAKLLKKYTKYR